MSFEKTLNPCLKDAIAAYLEGEEKAKANIGYLEFDCDYCLLQSEGSVEKVGVEPDPKRVGSASWNLEHG